MTDVSRDTLPENSPHQRKYRSPSREEQKRASTEKLIRATLDFVVERNFRPGMAAIAKRAGTHLALISRHFGSIEGLYAAVAEQHDAHVCDCAVEGAGAMLSPARRRDLAYVIMTCRLPE